MAEEEKKVPMTITPAKVEQRSVLKDLTKYAMDEYIKPKTNEVLHDLFSGVVDMFGDAVRGAIDKQFYGEDRSRNRVKSNGVRTFNQDVPYNVYSLSPSSSHSKPARANNTQRSGKSVKLISFNTEDEVKYIVSMMREEIKSYGNVKVGKLYETIKEPTSPEDWKYGWTDQNDIAYKRDGGLYTLVLAEPINVLINN